MPTAINQLTGADALAITTAATFTPFGTSPIRTVLEKLRDVISLRDFGAVGDGVTDDSAALLLALEFCRNRHNAGRNTALDVGDGTYRITFAKSQANTDPFTSQSLKAFYVFKPTADTAGWQIRSGLTDADPSRCTFTIIGQGCATFLHDGDANSWLWYEDISVDYPTVNFENIEVRPYDTSRTVHGMCFNNLMSFHKNLTASQFLHGVGLQYRRCDRTTVTNLSLFQNLRGAILGDPNSVNWAATTCNELTITGLNVLYSGANTLAADLDKQAGVESWQSEHLRVVGGSIKANNNAGLLIVGALSPRLESIYFETNGPAVGGLLTGVSAISGGAGYTNGETVTIHRTDGANATASGTATVVAGAVTAVTGLSSDSNLNFGFRNGSACTVTGNSSGAATATLTAVVSGSGEVWGLTNHVVINAAIAPVVPLPAEDANVAVANVSFEQCQIRYAGLLLRASATRKIQSVALDKCTYYDPGGNAGLHYVAGEEAYIGQIELNEGWQDFSTDYPMQTAVNGTTYIWAAQYTTRKLSIISRKQGATAGLKPAAKTSAFDVQVSPQTANVTGDGTAAILAFSTANFDDNADFDTTNHKFIAPVPGKYQFALQLTVVGLTSSHTNCRITFYKNGSFARQVATFNPWAIADLAQAGAPGATTLGLPASALMKLAKSDYVTVVLEVWGGTKVVSITTSTYLQGALLS